jgi:transposase
MVIIGIDPHKRTHVASAVEPCTNTILAILEIEASLSDYRHL